MANIGGFIKVFQDILRNDAGVSSGGTQQVEQLAWMLFLKIYDTREDEWELEDDYVSLIPDNLRWRNWAIDDGEGNALTGAELLDFVNDQLFTGLRSLPITPESTIQQRIVRIVMTDVNNFMKDGTLLRKALNLINDQLDFNDNKTTHQFNDIYETILKQLQAAGNSGEYYTPRALTDFIAQMIDAQLGERVADLAAGTGGFLVSGLNHLEKQVNTANDREALDHSVYGIEKMGLPYLLGITNLLLHGDNNPEFYHDNSLTKNVREFEEKDKFDVITMNPPFGGSELKTVQLNFPAELRSSETADLFMALIQYRLKKNGRAAVILPDGFLFGDSGSKNALKKRLIENFNLHTIVRLPKSVFAPYTAINTNILFFDNTGKTEQTWFYRLDMPDGYKNFSKTKPMKLEHFQPVIDWWNNRQEIIIDDNPKAKAYTSEEIAAGNYSLDLVGFPQEVEEVLDPMELITKYEAERKALNEQIDDKLANIQRIIREAHQG
ncbi:HsdM family class I SAM-dependent methyltransferase [Leuconostoc falkenbergense]|uniref:class I SAM-dependent DNA methyltransferase n=1 Tax=Leuconostoc falkenbergense TaxID=2766470 RepID=UPI00196764D6|nr:class I SAM-dependent DNA methyltransferase [Leuconostoc falkenbergense]QSB52177.1 SAM-dependent DNA methyltransferase [Leuconostoc falkenbergense]